VSARSPTGLKITRIGITSGGGSRFEEMEIDLTDAGEIGRLSEPFAASSVTFRENDPAYDYDWHCAPRRQFIVLLDGEIEVEVTSGEKRRFTGGDVVLVEDTTGTGHRTRTIGDRSRRSLFIPLAGG
jgi:quercetin dioxygenase-like cupin family protein